MSRPGFVPLAALALLLTPVPGPGGMALAGDDDVRSPLELSVRINKSKAKLGDQVRLDAILINNGTQSVVLRGMRDTSPGGGFRLSVKRSDGVVTQLPPSDGLSLADAQNGTKHQVLQPGAGIIVFFPVDLTQGPFNTFGKHEITVTYQSPTPTPGNPSITPGYLESQVATPAAVTVTLGEGAKE